MSEKDELNDLQKLLDESNGDGASSTVSDGRNSIEQIFDGSEYQSNVEAPPVYVEKDLGVTWEDALLANGGEITQEHASSAKSMFGSKPVAPTEAESGFAAPDRIDSVLSREQVGDKVSSPSFLDMDRNVMSPTPHDMNLVHDVPVDLTVELGRTRLPVKDVLKLATGTVVELDGLVGEAMMVKVNNLILAEGEVVVVNDRLGVRITNIFNSHEKAKRY